MEVYMKYTCYDMNAYNLHIVKTDRFKTITVGVAFRRKIKKVQLYLRYQIYSFLIEN